MSAAPRFSTADIAKNAQAPAEAREAEAAAVEREQALQREQELQREQAAERNRTVERMRENERENERGNETVIPLPAAATPVSSPVANAGTNTVSGTPNAANENNAPLFAHDAADDFRRRWDTIQASFVDDPKRAVQEADSLVAETMQRLADSFAQERSRLEQQFDRDSNVSTEDLRMTLRHYRSFFTRLLAV